MSRHLSTLTAILALLFSNPVRANVCGSDVSRYLVPDYVCFNAQGQREPFANCRGSSSDGLVRHRVSFVAACARHDACYARAGATKDACDTTFFEDLKRACRSQVGVAGTERMFQACVDTALQFNDVVRGQATRRFAIWMIQQVPFTGQSGCDAYTSAQKRAGVKQPTCTTVAASASTSVAGQWEDGGPGCASLSKGQTPRHFVLRTWYCEADPKAAKPIVVEHDATVDAYVHELTGLSVKLLPSGKLRISAPGDVRTRLGDRTYLAEEIRDFQRK